MNTETKEIQKHIDQIVTEIEGLTIESEEQYKQAASFLRDKVKPALKMVKDEFEPERKEKHAAYKEVTDTIKQYTDRLTKVESSVKRIMAAWYTEQERIKREEQRRIAAEAEERRLAEAIETGNEEKLEDPFIPDVAPAVEKEDGISYVPVWKFRIVNPNALPREYMVPDEQKIRKIVTALKADTQIPGVEVYEDQQVRVTT